MNTCSPDRIITALHEQTELITDIVREEIKDSPNLALRMISDGGTVARNANNSSVIYGEAKQASVAYNSVDHAARPLEAAGYTHADDFRGRAQNGSNGIFNNLANDYDNSRGQHTIDFAQGYRIRGFEDFELAVDTPIKDARELDRLGKEHIRGYFNGVKNQFTRWGMTNFSDNLLNLVIQHGEANAAVIAGDQFNVTTNGWQAPPVKRITIHFLQDYRDHIMAEMLGRGLRVPEDWVLEVEMPRQDWIDAVIKDQTVRFPTAGGSTYETKWFVDEEGAMRGRQFAVYGGIKCYFNERPIRGYFKKASTLGGKDNFAFVRVYDWINTMGENGGIVCSANHDYRKDSLVVDGIKYDMVTLIPHIDPRSFKRFGLMKPLKVIGGDNSGVNYEVKVIDGAFLGCNDFNDKFKLTARHEFRFKALYPELSGFIAYRHSQRAGYALDVTARTYATGPDTPAEHEQFQTTGVDDCMAAACAQCDQVSETTGECVAPEDADASVLGLSPAGAVTTIARGANYVVKLLVRRTGGVAACSVNYATANAGGNPATAGTDYTAASGTLTWEAGDTAAKEIEVTVLAAATDTKTFTVTLSGAVGATLLTGATVATLTIDTI